MITDGCTIKQLAFVDPIKVTTRKPTATVPFWPFRSTCVWWVGWRWPASPSLGSCCLVGSNAWQPAVKVDFSPQKNAIKTYKNKAWMLWVQPPVHWCVLFAAFGPNETCRDFPFRSGFKTWDTRHGCVRWAEGPHWDGCDDAGVTGGEEEGPGEGEGDGPAKRPATCGGKRWSSSKTMSLRWI